MMAAMAAIAFDAAHQTAGRFGAVLIVLRQMLDAFVSYRLRLAVG
jgi:hypothetical protein